MMDPPSRNAMWRFGYPNPVNYNDNEVFCGGFGVQFDKNGGKCGVCGDNYADDQPREHEAGGNFGNGVIGRRYVMGQNIEVEIDLTTNHWGHFVLKLCPLNDVTEIVTQDCLDRYPLYLASDPTTYKYQIPEDTKKKSVVHYDVMLPKGITCKQCVVQWTYVTGNTWGKCEDGSGKVGCGAQEHFRNCADVQIYSNAVGLPPTAIDNPNAIYYRDRSAPGGRRQLVVTAQVCVSTKLYSYIPGMDDFCQTSCLKYPPSCPKDRCKCLDSCKAKGRLADVEGTDVYCHRNCLRYPSTCPKDECECFSEEEVANEGLKVETVGDEVIVEVDNPNPNIQQGNSVLYRPWSPLFNVYRPIPARFQYPYLLMPYGK